MELVVLPLLADDLHPRTGVGLVVGPLLGAAFAQSHLYMTAVVAVSVPVAHISVGGWMGEVKEDGGEDVIADVGAFVEIGRWAGREDYWPLVLRTVLSPLS